MALRSLLATAALLVTCGGVPAEPSGARFTKEPVAIKIGDKIRIDFAVDRGTDVAVHVEDAGGRIVRHLVAGVLGGDPPAPLKANSLAQSVVWDGKNARVKTPAIPLAWPLSVVASDTHAYVADTINRRVVKVKLGYAVEAVCAVK